MSAPERVVIGEAELWWGDWQEIYEQLPREGAVVSDPPYGMRWDPDTTRLSGGHNPARRVPGRNDHNPIYGDDTPFDPAPWLDFRQVILWGANHYAQRLPRGTTLVWLKRLDGAFGTFLSDAELAWQKGGMGVYCYRDLSMNAETATRQHPTQKPLPLLRWCVHKTTGTVIDPFAGSFTTAVAALQLGRRFVGCEIDRRYFDIGCRRIEEAYRQLLLFPPVATTTAATQMRMLTGDRTP